MEAPVLTRIENDSSIEINKNSKGYTYSVKAYGNTPEQIKEKLESLLKTTEGIVKTLQG